MKTEQLFATALGLSSPWIVRSSELKTDQEGMKELHITIDFSSGARFIFDGQEYGVHDTVDRTWRHLDFFQHKCFLHCRVPRVKPDGGGIKQVGVPWARSGSGFTLVFEAMALQLIEMKMPVNKVECVVRENPGRIWTIIHHYVDQAYAACDHNQVEQIGIDETSTKKGHHYITTVVDMKTRAVVHVTPGKSKQSVAQIADYLEEKGTPRTQIKQTCIDLSPAFIAGTLEEFLDTAITFDRFHVVKLLNEAMDKVRRAERKEHELLKRHKYTFLKSGKGLSQRQRQERDRLLKLYPTLGEAYRLKVLFDDFWECKDVDQADAFLEDWCTHAQEYGVTPFVAFVSTLKRHWYGVVNYIDSKLSNGILEGLNTKIQLAKRRARGYRNVNNFIAMIYLIAAKLDFSYPYKTS